MVTFTATNWCQVQVWPTPRTRPEVDAPRVHEAVNLDISAVILTYFEQVEVVLADGLNKCLFHAAGSKLVGSYR
jgi:hypothetical protein